MQMAKRVPMWVVNIGIAIEGGNVLTEGKQGEQLEEESSF
jgi:hypothetical protein